MDNSPTLPNTYFLTKLTDKQHDEIDAMVDGVLTVLPDTDAYSRRHWTAIAHMALGKAQLIREGRYNWTDGTNDPIDDDTEQWAEELEAIARIILEFFQSGDMKI